MIEAERVREDWSIVYSFVVEGGESGKGDKKRNAEVVDGPLHG